MKKLILATAVTAVSVSVAQAAPTIYGKAFVTADYVNGELDKNDKNAKDIKQNSLQINSHSSRIGFKGSEAMTTDTDLVYQLEYGLRVDGDDNTLKSRDTYLGVKNKSFGEVRFGRNSSVLDKVNNVTVNQGYWDNLGTNKLASEKQVKALNMVKDQRQNNSIIWMAPKFEGMPLEVTAMYAADEHFVDQNNKDDKRKNGYGVSVMANPAQGFTAGVAYTKDLDVKNANILRGTVTYNLSGMTSVPVTLGALYQVADFDKKGAEKEKGFVVSASMGLNNFAKPATIYAQYNNTTDLNGMKDADSNQIVVGGKYMFQKNMIAHAYVGANKADNINASKDDANVFALGGGLEYKF